ncbi:MAG: hypothetical protein U1F11_10375 [Steroidobacteraceae bacterium]
MLVDHRRALARGTPNDQVDLEAPTPLGVFHGLERAEQHRRPVAAPHDDRALDEIALGLAEVFGDPGVIGILRTHAADQAADRRLRDRAVELADALAPLHLPFGHALQLGAQPAAELGDVPPGRLALRFRQLAELLLGHRLVVARRHEREPLRRLDELEPAAARLLGQGLHETAEALLEIRVDACTRLAVGVGLEGRGQRRLQVVAVFRHVAPEFRAATRGEADRTRPARFRETVDVAPVRGCGPGCRLGREQPLHDRVCLPNPDGPITYAL